MAHLSVCSRSGATAITVKSASMKRSKKYFLYGLLPISVSCAAAAEETAFDAKTAKRFAKLALACVEKEYPNKISHVLNSDADVAPPRKLTPAFYGCYDWH